MVCSQNWLNKAASPPSIGLFYLFESPLTPQYRVQPFFVSLCIN
jgi:hypothetical protein